jgi:hypothetical protein
MLFTSHLPRHPDTDRSARQRTTRTGTRHGDRPGPRRPVGARRGGRCGTDPARSGPAPPQGRQQHSRLEPGRGDVADTQRALAQERAYSSYGRPTPVPPVAHTLAGEVRDGIAPLPFGLSILGALIVGIGAGSGLHRLQLRRRAAGLAA